MYIDIEFWLVDVSGLCLVACPSLGCAAVCYQLTPAFVTTVATGSSMRGSGGIAVAVFE